MRPSSPRACRRRWGPDRAPRSSGRGRARTVAVVNRNTGTTPWSTANQYRRGAQNPQDNTTWGLVRAQLAASVPPGGTATFTFNVTAPALAGTYNFQWRMVQDLVE